MSTQPTAVLVHGAFADASGFAGVIRHLQAQDVPVRAPMNPLRGLGHPTPRPLGARPPRSRDRSCSNWYIVSEHDNAIPPDCERFMAQRMGAVTESVDGSHVAFIAKPDVASDLILKALASL